MEKPPSLPPVLHEMYEVGQPAMPERRTIQKMSRGHACGYQMRVLELTRSTGVICKKTACIRQPGRTLETNMESETQRNITKRA